MLQLRSLSAVFHYKDSFILISNSIVIIRYSFKGWIIFHKWYITIFNYVNICRQNFELEKLSWHFVPIPLMKWVSLKHHLINCHPVISDMTSIKKKSSVKMMHTYNPSTKQAEVGSAYEFKTNTIHIVSSSWIT